MSNKKWTAVAGVLLLAGIVASAIFLQQRNEARQRWRESRNQITDLEQRNAELNESLENQKSRLIAETDLAEKKQKSLKAVEIQMTELKARFDERQAELDTARTNLQGANSERSRLQGVLASAEERNADLASVRKQLEEERKSLASRIEGMESEEIEIKAAIAMLEQQAEEKDERIIALEKEIQTMRDTMAVKEKQLAERRDELWALQSETEGIRKELVGVKESGDELEVRVKELADERDGLIAQAMVLEGEGAGLRERITEMETRHREDLTSRNEKITALASALESKGEQLDGLEKDKGILTSKLKEANHTITSLRDQLQEVISQVPALKDSLEQSLEKYQIVHESLTEARTRQAKLESQQKAMRKTYEALVAGLKEQLDSQETTIEEYREKLKVAFVERILFGFSQVRISPEGKAALDQLSRVLANVPEGKISIIGHADNVPVAPEFRYRFPSNWELSSARAAAVARYLLKHLNLEPSQIEVIGLSYYQPAADNDTKAGRAKNRRVEIIIIPGR